MTLLSVNINKLATLRNSRGGNNPDLLASSLKLLDLGVRGITVHPRPDERHIRRSDVLALSPLLAKEALKRDQQIEFNIEGYPTESFLELVLEARPHQCTLVPDGPDAITSNAGWDFSQSIDVLEPVCRRLNENRIRSSLFLDVFQFDEDDLQALQKIKPDRVELYTEAYAKAFEAKTHGGEDEKSDFLRVLQKYQETARQIKTAGFSINAGHDLDHLNLETFLTQVPDIKEVSIGHALVSQALWVGFPEIIKAYQNVIQKACDSTSCNSL